MAFAVDLAVLRATGAPLLAIGNHGVSPSPRRGHSRRFSTTPTLLPPLRSRSREAPYDTPVIISRLSEEGSRRARIKRVPFTRGSGSKIYTFSLSLSFSLSSTGVRNYVASLKSTSSNTRG